MPDTSSDAQPLSLSWMRDLRRLTFAGVGVVSVGIGWVGVFVPGLPTTIFLIIASYCFTRSCPWLERRLLRVPIFARYMRVLDEGRGMSTRAVVTALISMWSCVGISLFVLAAAGRLPPWLAGVIVVSAVIGSATIGVYARKPSPRAGGMKSPSSA